MGHRVRLPWRDTQGDGPPGRIGDHAGFSAEAGTRPANRFTCIPLRLSAPCRVAPPTLGLLRAASTASTPFI
jgi:hypothetical protein